MQLNSNMIYSILAAMAVSLFVVNGSSRSHCVGTCYSGNLFPEPQDIFHGKHLKGYSYNNITTDDPVKCYSSCVRDCRCKACQMKDARCELLDEDKTSKADDFKDEPGYVYIDLKQTMYQGESHMIPPGVCYNGCCRSQPCLNGGTCIENCTSTKTKFTCKCQITFKGRICEKRAESCLEIMVTSHDEPRDGIYSIKHDDKIIPVFCDFQSPNRAWTLIESFSFESKETFKHKPFFLDSRQSFSQPNWVLYRLTLYRMKVLRSKSTLFRATCDFPNRNLLTPDLLIGRLSEFDFFEEKSVVGCRKYEYVNIRRQACSNCNVLTGYGNLPNINPEPLHLHVDVTVQDSLKCELYVKSETPSIDSFGYYGVSDKISKCTATPQSTTQWWLGEEK